MMFAAEQGLDLDMQIVDLFTGDHLGEAYATMNPPTSLQARARVNERLDWMNTQLCRDLDYGTVYPQVFPHHRLPRDGLVAL